MPEKKTEEKTGVAAVCGHKNKHFIPSLQNGKTVQGELTCTLEKGHAPVRVKRTGPNGEDLSTYEVVHSAPYKTLRHGALVDDITYWSDAAGEEVSQELAAKHALK